MTRKVIMVLLALVLALSLGLVGCGQSAAAAVVSESEGYLTVKEEDTANWTEAEVGMALEPTDIIRCGHNSSAEITFLDGSTIELDPSTEIEVAELVISTETDSAIIRLKLVIGSIIFRVVNIADPSSRYEVETPTGEVAIRGSAVRITVGEDGTTLVCNLEGDIWAIAQGVEVQVGEGECCVIRSGEPPELVVIFTDPNLEAAIRERIDKPTGNIYASDLVGLGSFDATEKNVGDLTGLEYCTSLIDLYLEDNQISDISPLANLTDLTALTLVSNQISDISPLANLTDLAVLTLGFNQISDISALADLTSLTLLYLYENQISDISALVDLTSLTRLALDRNQISDISSLASLTGLTDLRLSENQITDVSPLTSLTGLTVLELYTNRINDVSPLADLISLGTLHLGQNQISDISALANLTSLTHLNLPFNQISDISPLVDNEGLSEGDYVNLYGNPLSSDSINMYIPQLEARGVSVDY